MTMAKLTLFLTLFIGLNCYNIEVNKVGIFRGQPGSQFGYSVAFVRAPGWTNTSEEKEFYTKQLLVGAPNLIYNNIKAHGQISGCAQPDKRDLDCHWLNITDISDTCKKLKKNDTDCAFDSRLGATLVVNRQFAKVRDISSTIPMVTVCAPGWKNVYPEYDPARLRNFMIGMCLKLRDDLRPISCSISYKKYCWPFWSSLPDGTQISPIGRPVYTHAQGGVSAAFTKDGLSEIIGGPGADDWRGAFIAPEKNWIVRRNNTKGIFRGHTLLFGYSLDTGNLKKGEFIISGMPNYYSLEDGGHYGKFEIFNGEHKIASVEYGSNETFNCPDWPVLELRQLIDKNQAGTKFGASVATVDLTGDGIDELVVGAPLYSGTRPEEGRVFVYMFDGNDVCGPIGVLSGGAKFKSLADKASFARFGSAIASAGDLDLDGNKDLAVGSPYEDNGHGAVYIYRGIGTCMCEMKDEFSLRISGESIDSSIRTFGWSIFGDEDVDDNSFPDLAVGAYKSDMAVVLRSRPIVNVEVEMAITPNPIPMNGSQLQCSRDKVELCFTVTVFFEFASVGRRKGNVGNLTISWKLDSDTLYQKEKINSRVEFNGTAGLGSITENITLFSGNSTVKTYTLLVKRHNGKPEPQDVWTNIEMEGIYQLVPVSGQDFERLDPILNNSAQTLISKSVGFDKKCDTLDQCTSDLSLNVEMFLLKRDRIATKVESNTVIYVGAFNELEITTEVKNAANSSYKANFTGEVGAQMKREVSSNTGMINATCNNDNKMMMSTRINCSANSKLEENENFQIKSYFDISAHQLVPEMDIDKMRQNISVRMQAGQANIDTTPNNNDFERKINIKFKYDIHIEKNKEKSDQVTFTADENSIESIRLSHSYDIINEGPSFLPMSYVNISIPVRRNNFVLAVIVDRSNICGIRESQSLENGTTPNSVQSTEHLTIQDIENITCQDYGCIILECKLVKLGKQRQHSIHVTIDIRENEISKIASANKDIRQIRYLTTATLTDPTIWFGDKVVPLEKTVYAEKWTTLVGMHVPVVQPPTSLRPKVNNIWIFIGSALGAVVILVIVIIILWKCGFFARKRHEQVQEWKRANLCNKQRESSSKSTSIQQPSTSIDNK